MRADNAARIAAAARACVGTPYVHLGRRAGAGLDCLGLVIHALAAAGIAVQDRTDYPRRPDGKALLRDVRAHRLMEIAPADVATGHVLLFRFDRQPQHFGIALCATAMVHAFAPAGAVVETGLGPYWRARLLHVFRPRCGPEE